MLDSLVSLNMKIGRERVCTSSCFDYTLKLLASIERTEVEHLDYGPGFMQFWCFIWRWSELLQYFSSHTSGWLLHSHDRRISKITLHEEDHLFISHEHVVSTHIVQPPLYESLDSCFILVRAGSSGGQCGRHGRDKSFGVGGDEVL